jgi:hypothetical protein
MLTSIPSRVLRELVKLSERKEAHLAQIQAIDRQISQVQKRFGIPSRESNEPAAVTISRAPSRLIGHARTRRGVLKEKIILALKRAGKKGVTVRELAAKLRVPSANLYVWFNGTGRNVRGLKKIGVARYRLV